MRRPDWLAGASVLIGPVSVANSLLTGNFIGNFAFSGTWAPWSLWNCPWFAGFRSKFPMQLNREILSLMREIQGCNRENNCRISTATIDGRNDAPLTQCENQHS